MPSDSSESDRSQGTPPAPWQEDAPQLGENAQISEAQEAGEPRFGILHLAVNSVLPIIPGILLLSVVFRERKLRDRLPWPHWVGAGLYLYGWLLQTFWTLSFRLGP